MKKKITIEFMIYSEHDKREDQLAELVDDLADGIASAVQRQRLDYTDPVIEMGRADF